MDLKRIEKSIVHLKCYSEDKQDFGTALYVKKGNKQYLITVKHLIVNRNSGKLHESIIKANKYAENLKTVGVDQIYRLGSGESGEAPVVYENNHFEMDLAIISLNFNETIEFKRNLEYINCEKEEQPVIKYPMNYIIKADIIFSLMKEIESNENQHLHL
ncbi:hypothetical protein A6R78_04710 [Bacillus velezensis]|nr:hypothetical protein A6R78_04710 [Bacillus velezensis]